MFFGPRWEWPGKRCLVTGAASGLGRAMSEAFAERGAVLWLTDVDAPALDAFADELRDKGTTVHTAVVDVTDRQGMLQLADTVHQEGGPLDLLVNNAGIAVAGPVAHMDLDDWERVLAINVMGIVHGCHAFVPAMSKAPGRAHVVVVASAAAFAGVPLLGAYCVTKSAALTYAQALASEYDYDQLGVTALCPGFVGTNIARSGRYSGMKKFEEKVRERATDMMKIPGRNPGQVAYKVVRAVEKNRFLQLVYTEAWWMRFLQLMPQFISRPIRGWLRRNRRHELEEAEAEVEPPAA